MHNVFAVMMKRIGLNCSKFLDSLEFEMFDVSTVFLTTRRGGQHLNILKIILEFMVIPAESDVLW